MPLLTKRWISFFQQHTRTTFMRSFHFCIELKTALQLWFCISLFPFFAMRDVRDLAILIWTFFVLESNQIMDHMRAMLQLNCCTHNLHFKHNKLKWVWNFPDEKFTQMFKCYLLISFTTEVYKQMHAAFGKWGHWIHLVFKTYHRYF